MLKVWKLLLDWESLVAQGTDAVVYLTLAAIGTLLFVIRLALAMLVDVDSDFDDAGGHSDGDFSFFSILSILAFFMGAGWMGLACRFDWGLSRMASAFAAAGFGSVMMLAASGMTYATRRLNREVLVDVGTAKGKTARVYLTIPKQGEGHGQIEVSVSGRKKILRAVSNGPSIEAFQDVKVIDVRDDETLVVEPLDS